MPKKGRKGVDQRVKGNVKVSTPLISSVSRNRSCLGPWVLACQTMCHTRYCPRLLVCLYINFEYILWMLHVDLTVNLMNFIFLMRSWVGAPYTMVYNTDCVSLKFCFWLAVFAVFPLILLRSTRVFWKVATRCCTLWETPWLFCLQMVLYYKTSIERLMDAFMCVP